MYTLFSFYVYKLKELVIFLGLDLIYPLDGCSGLEGSNVGSSFSCSQDKILSDIKITKINSFFMLKMISYLIFKNYIKIHFSNEINF